MISNCSCKHESQDNLHGKSMRVFNKTVKTDPKGNPIGRCTVCSSIKTLTKEI